MATTLIILVIIVILAARVAPHFQMFKAYEPYLRHASVAGGVLVLILLVVQCMTSDSEGIRGGRRGRGGGRRHGGGRRPGGGRRWRRGGRIGRRAINRVLHGGYGGWTGYVPWWLYPTSYFPGLGGWSPYPELYPAGYGPSAYIPNVYPVGPCAQGCMADTTGSYGCPTPGYYPGQCRFASDCSGCAPGGVPALAIA